MAHLGHTTNFCCLSPPISSNPVLFRGATIATWDDSTQAIEVHRGASLRVVGDRITLVYSSTDPIPETDTEVIDASDKILVPGFINTHQHVWQTIYKTLVSNTSFADYVPRFSEYAPLSATLSVDEMYWSQLMGALEMLSEGTTSWIDNHGTFSNESVDAALQATLASEGRAFFGVAVHDIPGYLQSDQIAHIRDIANRTALNSSSLVKLGLYYNSFHSSEPLIRESLLDLLNTTNLSFITTHHVGGPWGFLNSPELLHAEWSLLNTSMPIVFSHASYLSPYDASLLRSTNQYISTTPESELHFGHGNPEVHRIQDQASLGADTQFPYSASLVTQARIWLQQLRGRLVQQQVDNWIIPENSPMSVNQALYLGTRAGALALRRPDLGIIAEGATADFIVFDTNGPHLVGWRDPVAAVILHSNPGDISDVIVAGRFVKRDFKLTFKDWDNLRTSFEESARNVERRHKGMTSSGEREQVFTLGAYGHALEVDVVRGNATGY